MEVEIIDLPFQGHRGIIAAFLVRGPDGVIVIETGPAASIPALQAGLAACDVSVSDVAGVFVSHVHLDHAGASGWWGAQGVKVHVHARGARHLIDPGQLIEGARAVYGETCDELWGVIQPTPADLVRPLADGEIVQIAGLAVEALETPGHAIHQHAFLVGGSAFVGDACGARLGGEDYISVTSAPPQFSLEHTLASLDRLAERQLERFYLTHFGVIDDPSAHLERYRDAVMGATEFIRQRLAEGIDEVSLRVAYEAFQLERAYQAGFPPALWPCIQAANGTDMGAHGIRLYWGKQRTV